LTAPKLATTSTIPLKHTRDATQVLLLALRMAVRPPGAKRQAKITRRKNLCDHYLAKVKKHANNPIQIPDPLSYGTIKIRRVIIDAVSLSRSKFCYAIGGSMA
jgi:hypothetical protein